MILKFPQWLSDYLMDPYKLFADVFYVRYYEEKIYQNSFFTGKFAPFFQKIGFQQTLGW